MTPRFEEADRFAVELLADCLREAEGKFWLRRAAELERARPMPGDYLGEATRADLSRRWRELTAAAEACRRRAGVSRLLEPDVDLVEAVWLEVAS